LDGRVIASAGSDYEEEPISDLVNDHVSIGDLPNVVARTDQSETFNGQVTFSRGSSGGTFRGEPVQIENDAAHYIHMLRPDSDETGLLIGGATDEIDAGIIVGNGGRQYLKLRTGGNTTAVTIDDNQNTGLGGETAPSYALDVSGTVNANDVRWGSDRRLKSGYEPVSDPLSRLQALTGYVGQKDTRDDRTAYHIAQEVEKAFPEAVNRGKGEDDYMGLYSDAIPALHTEAIKALVARVKELEAQVNG